MRVAPSRRSDGRASLDRGLRRRSGVSPSLADVRALAAGDASAAARLQRSIGNARVCSLLTLARDKDPKLGDRDTLPKDALPPPIRRDQGDAPEFSGCSWVNEDGGRYLKCGPLPNVPLDRDSFKRQLKKLREGDKPKPVLGPLENPRQGPGPGPVLPDDWQDAVCRHNPSLCQLRPPAEPELKPPGGAPYGVLWGSDVTFALDLPHASGSTAARSGMTVDGAATLASVVALMQADTTLQGRLVGHTSSEGTDADNLALSTRRVKAVQAELAAQGLGVRIMDLVGAKDPPGCTRIEFGMWACGESQADQGAARPADRRVVMTLLRNAPALTLGGPGSP